MEPNNSQILHLNITLSGTVSTNAGKEVTFSQKIGVSLNTSGDESNEINEAILSAVQRGLSNVVQEAVDKADRGY